MVRVAVIGCGYWGAKHVRVLSALGSVEQVVAIDSNPLRTEALEQSFPALKSFASVVEALDHFDAAVVATPPTSHANVAEMLLDHGKHVLVEKPLATTTADAERLVARAASARRTLMVGHTFEYNAAVRRLRSAVADGELGNVYYVDTARLNLGLYQTDVNVVWDLAPHDISIINHVLGSYPTTVTAWGSRHAHSRLEDVAYIRLEYEDVGATAQVHVSWLDPCKVRRVTVVGSGRMAVYNDLADEERIRIYDKGVSASDDTALHDMPMSYRYGGIVSPHISFEEPLVVEDRHFVECVTTGETPITDGLSGLAVVRVLEAAHQSLNSARPIRLSEAFDLALA